MTKQINFNKPHPVTGELISYTADIDLLNEEEGIYKAYNFQSTQMNANEYVFPSEIELMKSEDGWINPESKEPDITTTLIGEAIDAYNNEETMLNENNV